MAQFDDTLEFDFDPNEFEVPSSTPSAARGDELDLDASEFESPPASAPRQPVDAPSMDGGLEFDFSPDEFETPVTPAPSTPSPAKGDRLALPATPAAPGASSPWVRGGVTGFAGSIENAGEAGAVFNRVTGGDRNSALGQLGLALGETGKGVGSGYERQEPSFTGATGSFGEAYTYLAETMASGFASTFPSLVTGAGGAASGGAVGGPIGAAAGAWAGAAVPAFIDGVGGASADLRGDPGVKQALANGDITEAQLDNYALGAGAAIGGLDALGAGKIINLTGIGKKAVRETAKQSMLAAIRKGIKEGTLAEGGTEALQQILTEGMQAYVGGNLDLFNRAVRVVDSAIGGILVGGPTGGVGAGVEVARAKPEAGQPTPGGTGATPPPPEGKGPATEPAPLAEPSPERFGRGPEGPATLEQGEPVIPETPAAPAPSGIVSVVQPGQIDAAIHSALPSAPAAPQAPSAAPGPAPARRSAPAVPGSITAAPAGSRGPAIGPPAATERTAPGVTSGTVDPTLASALISDQVQAKRAAEPASASPAQRAPMLPGAPGQQPSLGPQPSQAAPQVPTPAISPALQGLPRAAPPVLGQPAPHTPPTTPMQPPATPPQGGVEPLAAPPAPQPAVSLEPTPRAMPAVAGEDLSVSEPLPEFEFSPDELETPSTASPTVAPAVPPQPAPVAGMMARQPEPPPLTGGNQRRALDEIGVAIEDTYDYARDMDPETRARRVADDRAEAQRFIASRPSKQPRSTLVAATREHLRRYRADRDARDRAAAEAPAMRERLAAERAASTERRAETAPQREIERAERAERLRTAEDRLTPEEREAERGTATGPTGETPTEVDNALDDPLEEVLNDVIRKTLAEAGDDPAESVDTSLNEALKAEAGGGNRGNGVGSGGGGKTPKGRGERPRPGTPQAKATRILRRAANAGIREKLRAGKAKTRWFGRKFLGDSQLSDFNEWRFDWTDDIDPAIRIEKNPMRQVTEARSREAARRERLSGQFAPLINRVDRLRRADAEAYAEFVQLTADCERAAGRPDQAAQRAGKRASRQPVHARAITRGTWRIRSSPSVTTCW